MVSFLVSLGEMATSYVFAFIKTTSSRALRKLYLSVNDQQAHTHSTLMPCIFNVCQRLLFLLVSEVCSNFTQGNECLVPLHLSSRPL